MTIIDKIFNWYENLEDEDDDYTVLIELSKKELEELLGLHFEILKMNTEESI